MMTHKILPYPHLDLKPGTRRRFRFMNGQKMTLVALEGGYFRPLLWRIMWDSLKAMLR